MLRSFGNGYDGVMQSRNRGMSDWEDRAKPFAGRFVDLDQPGENGSEAFTRVFWPGRPEYRRGVSPPEPPVQPLSMNVGSMIATGSTSSAVIAMFSRGVGLSSEGVRCLAFRQRSGNYG